MDSLVKGDVFQIVKNHTVSFVSDSYYFSVSNYPFSISL
ncbi:hypothetical protein SORDD16_01166 [Streptococcus oralis]|uniref:Uncharacterized protein n=1 Tax=Streptococcus oralis TaxID=1303 RepID=A0A139PD41_STROR|nr:hypothetical protein SORDD16_01166 [Streptococcus oralis]